MALWDGLKALFFVLIGLVVLALLPFITAAIFAMLILLLCGSLIVVYISYKKEERAIAKARAKRGNIPLKG